MTVENTQYTVKDRGFTPKELEGIAEIHAVEIGSGFLSSLGVRPLQLLYGFGAESKHSVLLVAFDQNESQPVGLIWGTLNCSALYREFLVKKGLKALRVFLPSLMSWDRMSKAFETLLYSSKKEFAAMPEAEILNFAVRPAARGGGLARDLFCQLMDRFKAQGVRQVKIVTGESQERAHRFYEKMGARRVGSTSVHRGHTDLIYVYNIP